MVITDRFIFIHYPKNGGTYVTKTLESVWGNLAKKYPDSGFFYEDKKYKNLIWKKTINKRTPHAGYSQIETSIINRPIISVIRNPFDRLVSLYHFKSWQRLPHAEEDFIKRFYPSYPDLSFKEYYSMFQSINRNNIRIKIPEGNNTGLQTLQFIKLFFYKPDNVLSKINDDYIEKKKYWQDIAPVLFLKTENLNNELYSFLKSLGVPESEIDFIPDSKKIYPWAQTRFDEGDWVKYYDEEILSDMVKREKLLFNIFPEYLPDEYKIFL